MSSVECSRHVGPSLSCLFWLVNRESVDICYSVPVQCMQTLDIAIISGSIGCDMQSITIYLKMIEAVSSAENATDISDNMGGMMITVHPPLFPVQTAALYSSLYWSDMAQMIDACLTYHHRCSGSSLPRILNKLLQQLTCHRPCQRAFSVTSEFLSTVATASPVCTH